MGDNQMAGSAIRLEQGNGGRWTRELVEDVFLAAQGKGPGAAQLDAARLELSGGRWAFTSDSFVVSPLEFPGGSIGSLAVHGTCNDLAVMGAWPRYASASFVLEEGLDEALLSRVARDMALAAREAGLDLVTGDTKVVERGKGDGIFIAMSGLGEVPEGRDLSPANLRIGDAWLVSGPVGDHGAAVMAARGDYALDVPIRSDSANLAPLVEALLAAVPETRFLRDATRGGIAQVLVEVSRARGLGAILDESSIPVRPEVEGLCDILGFDPLHLACEGRLVACVPGDLATRALEAMTSLVLGGASAVIGHVAEGDEVILNTRMGGTRLLEELEEDPIPRIC
jgi:hydrogenase expression/formation protein HypE